MSWHIVFSKLALKDLKKIKQSQQSKKLKTLLETIQQTLFVQPPHYEVLVGNLSGFYSRRINIQHRLAYAVHEKKHDSYSALLDTL